MTMDWVKPTLSIVGAMLLILLCVELLLSPGRTTANIIFSTVFLVLLGYALMRLFRRKK